MKESLFKLVFCNIVLLRNIYRHVRLFKKNEIVEFKELQLLREYTEREYIRELVYTGNDQLKIGDLPTSGILKKLEINCNNFQVFGNVIPYGVEEISFKRNTLYETPLISTLPSTVHTLENVVIMGPGFDISLDDDGDDERLKNNCIFNQPKKDYSILPNITSISFLECPNISQRETSIIIPDTIKHLEFNKDWSNQGHELRVGDLSSNLTSLKWGRVNFSKEVLPLSSLTNLKFISDSCELFELELPSSILDLEIDCNGNYAGTIYKQDDLFNFVPPNLLSFKLVNYPHGVNVGSNLHKCTSITKLSISGTANKDSEIEPNSLPPNLTDLELNIYGNKISELSIPNSVLSLSIKMNDIKQINKFPESLTNLVLTKNHINVITSYDLSKMISKLPSSLISLSLPSRFNTLNLPLPSNINVKYINLP